MINPISQTFKNLKLRKKPALLTYTVAGDDTKKRSLDILKSISKYADICELGFPHNTQLLTGVKFKQVPIERLKMELRLVTFLELLRNLRQ